MSLSEGLVVLEKLDLNFVFSFIFYSFKEENSESEFFSLKMIYYVY
jgi:hypothetical protein